MTDPIRTQILDAYVSQLGNITTSNGYRQSIDTIEVVARDWADPEMEHDSLPWCGVVPQDEAGVEHLPFGYDEVEWPILVVVHMLLDARTAAALVDACEYVRTDVRRALYAEPQLDLDGVMWLRVDGVATSEASPAAIAQGLAGVVVKTRVKFREAVSAS